MLLIVTVIALFVYFFIYEFRMADFTITMLPRLIFIFLMLWLTTGSPLVVSCVFSHILKHPVSVAILLVSTIVYGIWFVYGWYLALDPNCCMSAILLLYIAPGSLFWMIPAWIISWIINSHYVIKASANPGLRVAPSPALWRNNNK